MGVEVSLDLYSTNIERRRAAVYTILFERIHKLAPELKQAATIEGDEELAVLMTQVCLVLISYPRNLSLERRIIGILQSEDGVSNFTEEIWDYIQNNGNRQILISVIDSMDGNLTNKAHEFIEYCLNHSDPEIRAIACEIAIKSGRPTHLAHVLNLITDKDALVSETAYQTINEVAPANMATMIEYALGSSVEWVLENVAPFLPLLITKELRPVMTKFMYHPNELVALKVREALKKHTVHLRSNIKVIEKKLDTDKENESNVAGDDKHDIPVVSLKEQMEVSRKKREEEEILKREENDKIELELAQNTEEDNIEFENDLAKFTSLSSLNTEVSEKFPAIEEDLKFIDNTSFEEEMNVLSGIELNDEITLENEIIDDETSDNDAIELPLGTVEETVANNEVDKTNEDIVIDLTAGAEEIETSIANAEMEHIDLGLESNLVLEAETETESALKRQENITEEIKDVLSNNFEKDTINKEVMGIQPSDINEADELKKTKETIDLALEAEHIKIDIDSNGLDKTKIIDDTALIELSCDTEIDAKNNEDILIATDIAEDIPTDIETDIDFDIEIEDELIDKTDIEIKVSGILSPVAENILKRYPSFIVRPFNELFKPDLPKNHLDQLRVLMNQTTAFINSCFLQSCMFFAPPSEVLSKTIKECLRNHLTGSVSLRHMHNFAMSLKQSREKPVFFTFSLAKVMTESSDTNPLIMMRELTEYLTNPVEPLAETIPQAIDGMCEILLGIKSILHNKIIMKTPEGAKEPFADLSGPVASILAEDNRPALDLPPGELILISRDGREALGLFPYFKYYKRHIVFARPSEKDFEILLERLDLQM